MNLNQGDKVRYLGSEQQYYGKVATVTGVYISKKFIELTFENNAIKVVLDDVPINQIMPLENKRLAGDFEIINAIHIGDKEIVLGENAYATNKEKYLCSFCVSNDLFASYEEALVSDNYAEMVEMFGTRVSQQAEKTKAEVEKVKIDKTPLSSQDCYANNYNESIDGKIIAIKTNVIRREYRTVDRQLFLVTGGNGSKANSRGSAVFCTNLYSGNNTRWERSDVLGVVKDSSLPQWAKEKAKTITKKLESREER